MLGKILATAILCGFAAGILISVIQSVWVTPLIYRAETFEAAAGAGPSHPGEDAAVPAPARAGAEAEPWAPADGVERVFFTVLANVLSGIGFALLLAGAIALSGREVNGLRGALWGVAGFMVFGIAPAIGLPPDPPGVDAGPLLDRQVWWLGTVTATASGLALLVFGRRAVLTLAGVALVVLPHAIGAPHVDVYGGATPADVIDAFVIASLATTGLFWLALGGLTGVVYRKLAQ